MYRSPYLNAGLAAAYIWGIALLFQLTARPNTPDTILDPIAALSLLVFSAAFMAFVFFYHPIVMLLDGKRHEAVRYFFTTLGTFGVLMLLTLAILSLFV